MGFILGFQYTSSQHYPGIKHLSNKPFYAHVTVIMKILFSFFMTKKAILQAMPLYVHCSLLKIPIPLNIIFLKDAMPVSFRSELFVHLTF